MTYKLCAVVINQKTRRTERVQILAVEYDFGAALDAVDLMDAHRDQSEPFGYSIHNPLRFEACSPMGIAERF